MNKKTILFLDALAQKEGGEQMLHLARRHMQELFLTTLDICWPVDKVLWLTSEAKELKNGMEACWSRIGAMTRPIQGQDLMKRIQQLQETWRRLRRQTEKQLYTHGDVDISRMHLVTKSEEPRFRNWFGELVRIQLYRILVLQGAERFRKMEILRAEDGASLVDYYTRQIIPALAMMDREQLSGVWSVAWRQRVGFGGQIALPGCVLAMPQGKFCDLLPGQYRILRQTEQTVYEGRGALTNITPRTILQAQREGFLSEETLTINSFRWMRQMDMTTEPKGILARCTGGALYAMDPCAYFSQLSFACGMIALKSRRASHTCPLCGGVITRSAQVCAGCVEAMVNL